ncbi:MBOAT family O-acyltransferase [Butyrivibrio sp. WCD3002]|uniref:MBOAT family O-acyltransferase n=1 Tax=Butyrivibrio sp. WCD3002 TaxID=1280676 RepID=UPI0012DF9591|nr:MBOAT family O-acyltransferase [Butyrivibrio sp. WCD3002]
MFGVKDYVSLNIILPLGISFYLFQMMSYLFDVLYGRIEMERDFVKVAAYISFFPQITSGPIVKAKDFLPQLNTLHKIKKENVYEGLQLFLIGLTKKIVFADRIGSAVDAVYAAPAAYNGISVLFAVIGYSLQIYCDFSGYSNMAIGIAKIWDFDLGDNFNAPYIAKNPSDFWRRWHISLSTWFRDYVYIPLGGNRKGKLRTYFNLFITMVLSGLWHGANITFIVWGAVHGLGSAFHKAYKDAIFDKKVKSGEPTTISKIISILCTFVFVSAAWVLFRADSLRDAADIYRSLFNTTGAMYINIYVAIYIIFFIAIHFYEIKKNNGRVLSINLDLDKFKSKLIIAFWVWAIVLFMYCGNSAFIYAQF